MPRPIRSLGVLATTLGLITPTLAAAWTPYGYGQPGASEPRAGAPSYGYGQPSAAPTGAGPATGSSGAGAPTYPSFGSGFPPGNAFGAAPGYGPPASDPGQGPGGSPYRFAPIGTGEAPPSAAASEPAAPTPAPAAPPAAQTQAMPPAEPSPFDAGVPGYGYGPSAPSAEPPQGLPPSGYGMGGPPGGYYGPGYPPSPPFGGPEGFGMPPAAFPGSGPEGFGMPPGGFPGGAYGGERPGFQISRRTTPDAYILDIQLRGMRPDEVQVRAQGRWISIERLSSAQEVRQEQFDQGRGYARSFSYSSGSASRRMTLPQDADASAMQREDGQDSIRIRFPRIDRGTGYGAPPMR